MKNKDILIISIVSLDITLSEATDYIKITMLLLLLSQTDSVRSELKLKHVLIIVTLRSYKSIYECHT